MSGSSFYHISKAGKLSRVATVDAALAAAKDGGFVWLNYCQPTMEGTLEPHRSLGSPSAFYRGLFRRKPDSQD